MKVITNNYMLGGNVMNSLTSSRQFDKKTYIKWLHDFTITYPTFKSNQLDLFKEQDISELDCEHIQLLEELYSLVANYYSSNLLKLNRRMNTFWCNIMYQNVYYSIGCAFDAGKYYFVTRHESREAIACQSFVVYEDILNGKETAGVKEKRFKLLELQGVLNEIMWMDIPNEAILLIIKNASDELYSSLK